MKFTKWKIGSITEITEKSWLHKILQALTKRRQCGRKKTKQTKNTKKRQWENVTFNYCWYCERDKNITKIVKKSVLHTDEDKKIKKMNFLCSIPTWQNCFFLPCFCYIIQRDSKKQGFFDDFASAPSPYKAESLCRIPLFLFLTKIFHTLDI